MTSALNPPPARTEPEDAWHKRKRNAFHNAFEDGLYHDVEETSVGEARRWRVPSRSQVGVTYDVVRYPRVDGAPLSDPWGYACTCKAGEYHQVCAHRAAVQIWLALRQGYALEYSPQGDLEAIKRIELVKEYR